MSCRQAQFSMLIINAWSRISGERSGGFSGKPGPFGRVWMRRREAREAVRMAVFLNLLRTAELNQEEAAELDLYSCNLPMCFCA